MTLEVICAGEILWDLHAPPGADLETSATFSRVPGGAAANTARALAQAGVLVGVAGMVSDDALGRGLRRRLKGDGVDVEGLVSGPGRTGLVFIEGRGERFVGYPPRLSERPPWPASPSRIVHLAALSPAPTSLRVLAEQASSTGALVSVDLNARPRAWRGAQPDLVHRALVRSASFVKASVGDLQVLGRPRDEALEVTRKALGLSEEATLLRTAGAGPTLVAGPWGALTFQPAVLEGVGRVAGAGDVFCAGILQQVLKGGLPEEGPGWRAAVEVAHRWAARHIAAS